MERENRTLFGILVVLMLSISSLAPLKAQICNTCGNKGITTDPGNNFANAVNNEKPVKRNTFFDWTNLGLFNVNADFFSSQIESPFHQDGNTPLFHFIDNPDRLPEDGLELIKYDLGFN